MNVIAKERNRNLLALCIARVLHGFGTSMFTIVYQPFLLELTNSLFITGFLVSIGGAMQFLPMPLIGKISDLLGRKITIIISIPLYIIGLLLFIVSDSTKFLFLLLGIILYFLGFAINNLNTQFLVSENTNKSKGLMYGFTFFSFFIGSIGGSFFVSIGQGVDTRFYYLLFIGILIIESVIFGFFLSTRIKDHKENISTKEDSNLSKEKLWVKFIKDSRMRAILIFFSLDLLIYGISLSIYNGGLNSYYHLTKEEIASITIWLNISNMLFQIPAGHITDKIGKKLTIFLSEIFGLGFFIINLITAVLWSNGFTNVLIPLLIVANISIGFSLITFIPSEQIILTELNEQRKAESYGIITFVRGIAYLPTGIIGALLMERLHYIFPFIFSSIGVLIEIWILFKYLHD